MFRAYSVGIWRTGTAVELGQYGQYGQALQVAKAVHPELLPGTSRQPSSVAP